MLIKENEGILRIADSLKITSDNEIYILRMNNYTCCMID